MSAPGRDVAGQPGGCSATQPLLGTQARGPWDGTSQAVNQLEVPGPAQTYEVKVSGGRAQSVSQHVLHIV